MSSSRRPHSAGHSPSNLVNTIFDVPPERRTRSDLITAGAIAAVMLLTVVVVLFTGSASKADFAAAEEQPAYGPAKVKPVALAEVYRVPSAHTGAPLVTRGNLVTVSEDGDLVAYEAGVATEKWRYEHPGDLCGAVFYSDNVVSVWNEQSGCSDVTALNPTDQVYSSTRQSAFDDSLTMWNTWGHLLVHSDNRVEIWRSDLVRTVEYGFVHTPQEPDMQPRTGCTISSAGVDDEQFAVAERCPDDDSERLTISKTVPEDSRRPEDIDSSLTGADKLWILSVTKDHVLALQQNGSAWTVERFTTGEDHDTVLELDGEPELTPSPESVSSDTQVRWFDGAHTHAFDLEDSEHQWTATGTVGPGMAVGAGSGADLEGSYAWTVLPTPEGFSVVNSATGDLSNKMALPASRTVPLVGLAQVGDIMYEQLPGEVVAYKMTTG